MEFGFKKNAGFRRRKKKSAVQADFYDVNEDYSLELSPFPALNLATFFALILMVSPVAGLRPFRAALFETEKVPKPTSVNRFPDFKVLVTPSIKESRAAEACTFVRPASSAILLTNSALFIVYLKVYNGWQRYSLFLSIKEARLLANDPVKHWPTPGFESRVVEKLL